MSNIVIKMVLLVEILFQFSMMKQSHFELETSHKKITNSSEITDDDDLLD